MTHKFKVVIDFKLQSSQDNQFTPLNERSLDFPAITDMVVDGYNKYGEDGGVYQVVNWVPEAGYKNQEFFDRRTHSNQIVLQNDTEIMIETESPNKFNNLRIKWAHCGCFDPIIYRLTLSFITP